MLVKVFGRSGDQEIRRSERTKKMAGSGNLRVKEGKEGRLVAVAVAERDKKPTNLKKLCSTSTSAVPSTELAEHSEELP